MICSIFDSAPIQMRYNLENKKIVHLNLVMVIMFFIAFGFEEKLRCVKENKEKSSTLQREYRMVQLAYRTHCRMSAPLEDSSPPMSSTLCLRTGGPQTGSSCTCRQTKNKQ